MGAAAAPEMSVVLVTHDDVRSLRKTLQHLAAQEGAERLELVLVGPSRAALTPEPALLAGFGRVKLVEVGAITRAPAARAAGVRHARAPIVTLLEDHSFPRPGWARALIAAHRGPWAAVGPAVDNANAGGVVSWANHLIGYGDWLPPIHAGEVEHLPGHNSAYKRAALLAHAGADLDEMLAAESVLHWALRARGERLYLEPAAVTDHLNPSTWRATLAIAFFAGRQFGAARARGWPAHWRLLYAAAAPLIPAVRLRRIARTAGARRGALGPRLLGVLVVVLAADAAGQLVGYLCGSGDVERRLLPYEVHRERLLNARDRAAIATG